MDFDTLNCFLAVAQQGSLTGAAKALHISQSALSGIIKSLEEEVGQSLFIRSRGSAALRLNEGGKAFAETAHQILKRQEESTGAIQKTLTHAGNIHIGVQSENDGFIFLLSELHKKYPKISFHLHSMRASIEDYLNSDMDFYVLPEDMKGDLPSIRVAVFGNIYAIVARDHPLAKRRVLRLEELKGERFAFAITENGELEETYQYCIEAGLEPDIAFLCDDMTHQLEMARLAGVVLITHNTFRQFRRELKGLVEIPLDHCGIARKNIFLAWPPQPLNPLTRLLAEDILRTYPDGITRPEKREQITYTGA